MKKNKFTFRMFLGMMTFSCMLLSLSSCDKKAKEAEANATTDTTAVASATTAEDLYAGMDRKIKANIVTVGERRYIKNTRGKAFGGVAALVGTGRNQRAHVYTATLSEADLVPGSIEKIDAKKLAADLGVVACVLNTGRFWTMDEMEILVGEEIDFQGVKMAWVGDMTSDEIMQHFGGPYVVGKILRNTKWIYKAGTKIQLLREPNNGTVWVMQEYTKEVDPTQTMENLDQVGSKLKKLPKGWTFETKVLEKDLTLDTRRTGTWASILRDELGNTYEGVGFDDLANYIP
jgi:hypothetical protein